MTTLEENHSLLQRIQNLPNDAELKKKGWSEEEFNAYNEFK